MLVRDGEGAGRLRATTAMTTVLSSAEVAALIEEVRAERQRTVAQVEALTRDFDEIVQVATLDPPDDEHDPDGTTIAWEREQISALLAHAREQLDELDRAEAELQAGTFGNCTRCDRPIGFERLMARPTASRCITCAV